MLTIRISEMVSFGSTKPWMPSAEARINIDLERGGSSCGPYSRVYATAVVTPTEEGDLMTACGTQSSSFTAHVFHSTNICVCLDLGLHLLMVSVVLLTSPVNGF